jgi:hypothetical protein
MKYLAIFWFLFFVGCNSVEQKSTSKEAITAVKEDTAAKTTADAPASLGPKMNFFDSIMKKMDLTISQMKAHTTVDSIFYTGRGEADDTLYYPGHSFKGDSIIRFSNGITGALLHYNDGLVCSKKWLFLYRPDSAINSDDMEIQINCDRDEGFDYYYTEYRLLNDSMFETNEYKILANRDDEGKLWEKKKYKVNSNGRFVIVQSKEYHK